MRIPFYVRYALRSLARGGQRTLLAVFCIAVGVTAVVGLQLVASAVRLAIAGNARAVNQGDLYVGLQSTPLQRADLAFFDGLRARGLIRAYTPQTSSGGILQAEDGRRTVSVRAVDPATFPLVGSDRVNARGSEPLAQALAETGTAVATSRLAADLHLKIGATFRVLLTNGTIERLRLTGIAPAGSPLWSGNSLTVSLATWEAATGAPASYQAVAVTTGDPARTTAAAAAIHRRFPLANVRSAADVLRQAEKGVETTRRFLILIGLLALLIGGAGIMNTMQVLLSRRRVEIAVLKTSGYRRRDLYILFGLEASILGVAGGLAGALLGIAVAAGLRALFLRVFPLIFPLVVDLRIVASGLTIGLATALIFGLLPIVRAAAIRPQAVLRDLPDWQTPGSGLQSGLLVLTLSALFFLLASAILNSFLWGAAAVYGGFAVLALVSLALAGILWLLARLPVPDRLTLRHVLLVSSAVLPAAAIAALPSLRGVGVLLLAFTLLGYAVVFLPRTWKVNTKLALRNIGRTRARTTATLLALFIGVFAVGLILVLGLDLKANLGDAFASQLDYDAVAVAPLAQRAEVQSHLAALPGLHAYRVSDFATATPVMIDGQPVTRLARGPGSAASLRRQLRLLGGVQGYDLGNASLPDFVQIAAGRGLGAADAGSGNVLVEESLRDPPLRLAAGDTVTLKRANADTTETLTVAGFYRLRTESAAASFNLAPILGPQEVARLLAGSEPYEIFYLQVTSTELSRATNQLQAQAPDAIVLNLEDFLSQFEQVLNNILIMLTAVASLALLAGIIIVANAVALAMLERRRELGILKAVGYTSGRVLTGVLIENGLTAGLGGLLGMAPVPLAVAVFDRQAGVSFGVSAPLSIAVVLGVVVLTLLTTLLVAWTAVRVRPLAILRYE